MSISTQTAVVSTEGGGVITEINVTALGEEHVAAALALMAKLIEATSSYPKGHEHLAVVGVTPVRQAAARDGVLS
jgi:hypothetical protein